MSTNLPMDPSCSAAAPQTRVLASLFLSSVKQVVKAQLMVFAIERGGGGFFLCEIFRAFHRDIRSHFHSVIARG